MLYDKDILLKELDISDEEKDKLIQDLKNEFPHDEMLLELHLFRAVQYLKKQKIAK
jgi:hypothetical protein